MRLPWAYGQYLEGLGIELNSLKGVYYGAAIAGRVLVQSLMLEEMADVLSKLQRVKRGPDDVLISVIQNLVVIGGFEIGDMVTAKLKVLNVGEGRTVLPGGRELNAALDELTSQQNSLKRITEEGKSSDKDLFDARAKYL